MGVRAKLPICALLVLAALAPPAQAVEKRTEVSGRPGVLEPFLYDLVPHPIASVILFNGGDGDLAHIKGSFLMRVRRRFVAAGMNVLVPDTPSDHPGGFGPLFRIEPEHSADIDAIVRFIGRTAPTPIFLIGISNGTISATDVAARLGPKEIAGIILLSSVWLGGLAEVPVDKIAVSVLVVHNRADRCPASPFAPAQQSLPRFADAPIKGFIEERGRPVGGDPCGANSGHDFEGLAAQLAPQLIAWIKDRVRDR